jgi:hypothetical protein
MDAIAIGRRTKGLASALLFCDPTRAGSPAPANGKGE